MVRSICRNISAIVFLMALSLFAFKTSADNASSPLNLLNGLRDRIQENDPSIDATFSTLENFFSEHNNEFEHAHFLNIKSYSYILKQEYLSAYTELLQARDLASSTNNKKALAESYRLEGLILDFSGEHANALEALNTSLALYREVQSSDVLRVYQVMGNVYTSLENYEQMIAFGESYLATAERLGSLKDQGIAYLFQGYTQHSLGNYQEAIINLLLAEDLLKECQYPFIGIVYSALTDVYIEQGSLTEALIRLNQAAEADRRVNFRFNEGSYLLKLAEIYKQRGENELAIAELETGLNKDVILNDKSLLLDLLDKLINLYEEAENYSAALNYSKQYREAYTQSFNEQQSKLLALNRVRLSISEKEETIKLLEKDNQLKEQRNLIQQKQNTFQLYFIGCVVLSLVLVIGLLTRTMQQRKALDNLTQDLQKATKAKSDFLARMSHEIRTPLNAIIGLTKLSQRAAENQEQQTNLIQIEGASQTLLAIIKDILDFSKIEAGKLDIEATQFNLEALVNQTIRLHLARADEKQIELIQHIDKDVPLNLIGDPLRLQQVLSNLLSNALKFTEDGLVSVNVRCTKEEQNIQLEFEVKDTGIGLSNKQKAKLFKPFNQGDESISRRFGGTGLGLAISKQLTTLMGGEIWVESQLGKGASFYFTVKVKQDIAQHNVSPSMQQSALKVLTSDDITMSRDAITDTLSMANIHTDKAAGGKGAEEIQVPDLTGVKILFAEDNALNQKVALGLLSDTHATIKVVNNGLEALKALREDSTFDVVLMDIQMPVMDGLTAAKRIREELKLELPVIAMTAHAMQQDIDKSHAAGMDGHINKPVDPNRFFDVLVEVLDDQKLHPIPTNEAPLDLASFRAFAPDSLGFIDRKQAMQALLNDVSLYKELTNDFIALSAEIHALRTAIDEKDFSSILRIAHIFTTALKYIGAYRLAELASSIELTIQQNKQDTEGFFEQVNLLHSELTKMYAKFEQQR